LEDLSESRFYAPLLAAGRLLAGRFRVVARLGEGAIGEVYEATDLELEEQVALKVLRPEIAREPEVLHRFKREIQLARRVTHPGVCRTFDLFHHREENGAEIAFVTMELLRGETLEERLARVGPMNPAEALPLAAQIAEGLQAAHQAGVVHRDFKSSNVMLVPGPEGMRAVVTDFGLAWSSSVSASVTRTGSLIGSPAYMAPEQVRGEAVTPTADVFAFGIVLYEMVTGRLPFSADTAFATALKRLHEPPTLPRVYTPGLDSHWEEVILRCLESDPAERFATPVEVARALTAPRDARVASRAAARRRRSRWALAAGSIAALGLAAVLLAWQLGAFRKPSSDSVPRAAPRPAVAVFGFENLSGDPEVDYLERSLVRLLPFELAAGERLRLVSGEEVNRARQDLALAAGLDLSPETLSRLRDRLAADYVITGSYYAGHRGGTGAPGRIRCAVTIQNARSGEIVASLRQEGTEEDLLDLVDSLGMQLRRRLGADDLSPGEEMAARAARPAGERAARLYAEGLEKLSRFEALQAVGLLEQARDADPENALIRADLAAAWRALGWQARAEKAAGEAVRRASGLGFEPRRRVEARYCEISRQWDRAAAIYRELGARFPDDLEYGLGLVRVQIQKGDAGLALDSTIERLRASLEPWRDDPRIDLAEAEAALTRGDATRAMEAARRAQRKGEAQGASLVVARALHFQGLALRGLARLTEARAVAERSNELFRGAGDLASSAAALITVGSVLVQQGDLAAARQTFDNVVAVGRAIGNEETRASGLANLGVTFSEGGDLAGAGQSYEEALAIFRRTGSRRRAAQIAVNLARVDQRLGQRSQARALFEETLATLRDLGDRSSEAAVLINLAAFSLEEGKLQEARDQAFRALALHRELGELSGIAEDRRVQGEVLALSGDLPAAQRELEAAATSLEALGEKLWAALYRIDLARVLVEAGRAKEGETLARTALAGLGTKPPKEGEVSARTVLAWAALEQGRMDAAADELARAAAPLAGCTNRVLRLQAALVAARVHGAMGKGGQAAGELRAMLVEAERLGLRPLALEARLVLGELEAGSGDAAGRTRLAAVAREATVAGYGSLARRAQHAGERGAGGLKLQVGSS
jgi:tetratricopeptide (TPR) repeat protein/tRNA A-37 threonylcarbamoyl transferase component Bud32